MTPEDFLLKIAKLLEKLKISYLVTGGFAVCVLAKPRFTADIDIVIELTQEKIPSFRKNLLRLDKNLYIPDEAIIKDAVLKRGEFNIIHSKSGLKVDFWAKRYPFEKFERGISKKIGKQKIIFISPEDLILSKLLWYKESESTRHLEDIKSILEISKVDLNYIKKWAERQSTMKIFKKLLKKYESF